MKSPTIFAAIIITLALIGGFWMFTHRALSHVPASETFTVTLPQPERIAGQAEVLPEPETVTVERLKPWYKYTPVLFSAVGFVVLGLAIVGAGVAVMVWER